MSREARILFIAVYLLVAVGVVMIYSASAVYAEYRYVNSQYFLVRQILYVVLGTIILFVVSSLPTHFWKFNARLLMLLSILLLLLTFAPVLGHSAGGARRWIRLGWFNFQPVEFAKLAVCLYLADYFSRKKKSVRVKTIQTLIPPFLLIGLICGLVVAQPDLGSFIFILLIVGVFVFLVGVRLNLFLGVGFLFVCFVVFLIVQAPYRLSRITAFLNPWEDPQGSGFQIIQSFLAFSLGGVQGVGLGESMQKLFYLPSSYNDFIFSIIGEELGLVGVFFVMFLYAIIFICGIRMALKTTQDFDRLVVISLTFSIVLQALIHMLVTTGLVPTKGLPLPFVSSGGTSMVFNLMTIGVLLGRDRRYRDRKG